MGVWANERDSIPRKGDVWLFCDLVMVSVNAAVWLHLWPITNCVCCAIRLIPTNSAQSGCSRMNGYSQIGIS